MRWPILLFVLVVGQCVSASTPSVITPVRSATITIRAIPVALYPSDPARRRVGALTYVGGWQLVSDHSAFGGLSSLALDGGDFTALTDAGGLIRFRMGRFGHVSQARIMPLPRGCGGDRDKTGRDTESLARDPDGRYWWIGFEWRNAICRTNGDFSIGERVVQPPLMTHWPRTAGPETLLRLADGRFLVFAERNPDGARVRPISLFDRDPADPSVNAVPLGYRPPEGFSPTDAAQLPDGRLLVLNRRFALGSLFTACITLVDPRAIRAGAVIEGPVVARFEAPTIADNFEGIAIGNENGKSIVWIVSDDNFASWQRTLLLKFAVG